VGEFSLLKDLLLPPVGLFLLLAVALFLSLRRPRAGRWLAACALAVLWLMATPLVANALGRSLSWYAPLDLHKPMNAQAIVILGGGVRQGTEFGMPAPNEVTLQRLLFGARVASVTKLPVLVAGGTGSGRRTVALVMKSFLEDSFHIPVTWVESASRDTRENAIFSGRMLHAAGVKRIILVTSSGHMPRSVLEFEHAGFEVIAAPTVIPQEPDIEGRGLAPNAEAILRSYHSLYEWAGLSAARIRLAIAS
jgi:uncharacterized SAM-binding protein YcdF (DUF218 family)